MRFAFAGKCGAGRMPLNGFWILAAPAIASRPNNPNRAAPPSPYANRPKKSRRLIPKLICEHIMVDSPHNYSQNCLLSSGTGGRNPNLEIRNSKQARISEFETRKQSLLCFFESRISFENSSFGIRICFEIRVSIFEFLPPHRPRAKYRALTLQRFPQPPPPPKRVSEENQSARIHSRRVAKLISPPCVILGINSHVPAHRRSTSMFSGLGQTQEHYWPNHLDNFTCHA